MSANMLDCNLIYRAAIEHVADPATIACSCDGCDWKGAADQLAEIQSAVLTPGHASPAGRCPECDSLAYVDQVGPSELAAALKNMIGLAEEAIVARKGSCDPEDHKLLPVYEQQHADAAALLARPK